MRKRPIGLTVAMTTLAIPRAASAHGGNDDPNAVHACIVSLSS